MGVPETRSEVIGGASPVDVPGPTQEVKAAVWLASLELVQRAAAYFGAPEQSWRVVAGLVPPQRDQSVASELALLEHVKRAAAGLALPEQVWTVTAGRAPPEKDCRVDTGLAPLQ